MKFDRITKNPFLLFLPFLIFYVLFILIISNNTLWGDEIRHMNFVNNLIQGFYSPPAPNVDIDNGPGYPLFILPFVALHLPLIFIKLLNAVLLYFSNVLLYKTLIKFISFRKVLLLSLFWGCYYNSLDFIALIYSEALSVFLISVLILILSETFNNDKRIFSKKVFLAGFIFGCLVLTKIIFGYVVFCMLIGCGFLLLLNRRTVNYQKGTVILIIAIATISPYLIYTYQLTGKVCYLATSGGNNLYWMSSVNESEYGSWFPPPGRQMDSTGLNTHYPNSDNGSSLNIKTRTYYITGYEDSIKVKHQKDFEEINQYKGVEQDDVYKRIAINNIKSHPIKFIQNCFSNVGRILFNYPYSYTIQKPSTLIRLPLNGTIIVLALFCMLPTLMNWRKIHFSIRFMLFIASIYLGGSIFGCAEIRMFTLVVPILLVWIGYILEKTIKININKWGS